MLSLPSSEKHNVEEIMKVFCSCPILFDFFTLIQISLYKKWSFPLRISSENEAKSAGKYGFGHIYWRNRQWKTSFFVWCILSKNVDVWILTDTCNHKELEWSIIIYGYSFLFFEFGKVIESNDVLLNRMENEHICCDTYLVINGPF